MGKSILNLSIGNKIRYFRKLRSLSQLSLEIQINAPAGSISRIENGEVNPTKETILKISKVLKLNKSQTGELLGISSTSKETLVLTEEEILIIAQKVAEIIKG